MQSDFQLQKWYIAEVYGDITSLSKEGQYNITFPIAHHRFNSDRMVVIKQPSDIKKTK
jgi:hypothetical protein